MKFCRDPLVSRQTISCIGVACLDSHIFSAVTLSLLASFILLIANEILKSILELAKSSLPHPKCCFEALKNNLIDVKELTSVKDLLNRTVERLCILLTVSPS